MRHLLATVLLCGAITTTAQADIFKCPNGKGGSTFQDQPCTGGGTQLMLPTGPTTTYGALSPASPRPSSPEQKAERRSQWAALCKDAGEVAAVLARGRDQGLPISQSLAFVDKATGQHPGEFQAFFTQMFRNMVVQVYDKNWWTPAMAQQRIDVTCVKEMEQQLQALGH